MCQLMIHSCRDELNMRTRWLCDRCVDYAGLDDGKNPLEAETSCVQRHMCQCQSKTTPHPVASRERDNLACCYVLHGVVG